MFDEDTEALIKKVDKILKKHNPSPGITAITIDEPGKITRFKKGKDTNKKDSRFRSSWLVDEGYGYSE